MTANRRRRRRSMWLALGASVLSLVLVGALSLVAVSSMADSRAGRDVGADTVAPARQFPWTGTALIGLVDDDGMLRATAVGVLDPDGRGGTLLSVSPSADASAGNSPLVRPLGAVFAVDGPEAWRAAVEQLTGLSFDVAEVADHDRMVQLLTPLGDLPVAFPFGFTDASTGQEYGVGGSVLSAAGAVRALNATNPGQPDWQLDFARDAVWSAIADRVGAGIGSLEAGVRIDVDFPPTTLDAYVDALFAAPVAFRSLSTRPIDADRVATQMPVEYAEAIGPEAEEAVVTHRRAELILMFTALAPARIGAPTDGATVRLVSGFTTEDTTSIGISRSDLLTAAIDQLLFGQTNVVSVVDSPGASVPDATRLLVSDDALIDGVWETFDGVFGEMQVVPAAEPIVGVDIEIMLGRDYLPALSAAFDGPGDAASDSADDVAGSDS